LFARRRGLVILALAAGDAALGYAAYTWPLKAAYRWIARPALRESPTGPLSEATAGALLAATEALIPPPFEAQHYMDFFHWRAAHLHGHRELYTRFAAAVERRARKFFGAGFDACDRADRRRILADAFQVRAASGRVALLRRGLFARDWVLFDAHIIRPMIVLFARTDAWRQAGYASWPGLPRGLDRYTRAHALTTT
jgi:hypothetical protein